MNQAISPLIRGRKCTKSWTMKNGSKIRICDMTDAHLINTIRFLERSFTKQLAETPYPCFEGEMAQYYAESEYEAFIKSDISDHYPIYDDLESEARNRGLTHINS